MTEVEEPHNLPAITGCLEAATYCGKTFVEHAGRIGTARRRMCAEMSESRIILNNVESRASGLARWESLRNRPFLVRGHLAYRHAPAAI